MNFFRNLLFVWNMRSCPHPDHRLNCLHGKRINDHNGKRSVCLDCGKYRKELPAYCMTASIRSGYPVYHNTDGRLQNTTDDE